MSTIKCVFKKELQRVTKDKKLLFSLFVLPPLLVIVIYSLVANLADSMTEDIETHSPVIFIADAPASVKEFISATSYDTVSEITYISKSDIDDTVKDLVLDGSIDLIAAFPDGFEEAVSGYGDTTSSIPNVEIFYNSTKNYSSAAYSGFEAYVLSPYRQSVIADRVGSLDTLTVFNETTTLIVDEDEANGQFLAMMVPYLVVMLLFASAMGLCVDATAGEKERGTLASLLMTPAKRSHIAIGKLLGLSVLAAVSAVLYAVAMLIAMPNLNFTSEDTATDISFSGFQILAMLLLLVVLVYLFVAVISLVSILAKDVKTASSMVSPMYIVVIVLGMITMFQTPGAASLGFYAIPVYGTALAIQNIMINALTVPELLLSVLGELILGIAFTYGIKKAFDSEKIIFNA